MQLMLGEDLIDITTIHNGIFDGELKIYNKEKVVFSADIGINQEEIDLFSLEIYKHLLMIQPIKRGVLDIEKVLTTMEYITPNFTFSNCITDTTDVVKLGAVKYIYDNEMLTVVDKLEKHSNQFITDSTEVYRLYNSEFDTLYITKEDDKSKLEGEYTNLMDDSIQYTFA